jgi:dTDP-4-dehydrorhamnose reductase
LAEDVASAVSELLEASKPVSLLHLGGPESLSRFQIGEAVAEAFNYPVSALDPVTQADLDLKPSRPKNLSFDIALARKVLSHPPRSLRQGLSHLAAQAPSRRKR